MKTAIKTEFVDALRSGAYAQGRLKLRNHNDGYCCLGVLTDLAVKAGIVKWVEDIDGVWGIKSFMHGGNEYIETTGLPKEVIDWAGFTEDEVFEGNVNFGPASFQNLMYLNDSADQSFAQIADVVEENL